MKKLNFSLSVLIFLLMFAVCGKSGGNGIQTTCGASESISETPESTAVTDALTPDTTVSDSTVSSDTVIVSDTDVQETTAEQDTDESEYADFSDALFIGDSRTVGLYLYGRIDGARYFARTSMNVYNCFGNKPSETDTGKATLEEYLSENSFGKIYILLGINEIGYPYDSIIGGYGSIIEKLRTLQPEARIVIQSNMHVTKEKSDANPNTFNNERVSTLNERLEIFCEENGVFFLDIAATFNDSTGALDPKYSRDGIHFNVEGYRVWREWLRENGLV